MFFASQGDGHHPGMAFHASFVALFNGEGQRIVSGIASGFSCQYGVEGFDVRTIKHITTGTSLEKYRIEVGLFQAVEDIDRSVLLSVAGYLQEWLLWCVASPVRRPQLSRQPVPRVSGRSAHGAEVRRGEKERGGMFLFRLSFSLRKIRYGFYRWYS